MRFLRKAFAIMTPWWDDAEEEKKQVASKDMATMAQMVSEEARTVAAGSRALTSYIAAERAMRRKERNATTLNQGL